MTFIAHETICVDGGPRVDMFVHADGTVVFDTLIPLGKTYSATSLHMPADVALKVAAALIKAANAVVAHQNAAREIVA